MRLHESFVGAWRHRFVLRGRLATGRVPPLPFPRTDQAKQMSIQCRYLSVQDICRTWSVLEEALSRGAFRTRALDTVECGTLVAHLVFQLGLSANPAWCDQDGMRHAIGGQRYRYLCD